jgi:hypothetical protein
MPHHFRATEGVMCPFTHVKCRIREETSVPGHARRLLHLKPVADPRSENRLPHSLHSFTHVCCEIRSIWHVSGGN